MITAAGSGHRRGAASGTFVVAAVIGLAVLYADRRPEPLLPDQLTHPEATAVFVTARLPLELEIAWPARPSALRLAVWIGEGRRPLRVRVAVRGQDGPRRAVTTSVQETGLAWIDVPADAATDAPWRVSITSDATTRESAPRVLWSRDPPRWPVAARYGGQPLDRVDVLPHTGPLLMAEYAWPTRWALALWLAPALLAWPAWRRGGAWRAGWLAALGLAATLSSALLWQRDYTRRAAHLDADGYAASAQQMARFVVDPDARPGVAAWLRAYPHSTTQLVPALLVPPALLGLPVVFGYLLLSALASWLALLLVQRLATRELGVSAGVGWLATATFACHPVVLRSFARPVTDAAGLLLVLATLCVLARRLHATRRRDDLLLVGLLLAQALARPQGLGYWPFVAAATLLVDRSREGRWPPLGVLVRRQLVLFGPPIVLLLVLYASFDWWHNVGLMLAKARRFRIDSTLADWVASMIGVVQLVPAIALLAAPSVRRRWADPSMRLLVAWGGYAVALLVAVRAPFWLRHFLPVLPVPFLLAARWIDDLAGPRRAAGIALLVLPAIGGVVVTVWQIAHLDALPVWIASVSSVP